MYLKSIIVKGFKSFPDRCKLEFGPGCSVIVGPNGSGKSNVTDAVLWALGEQSPLAVRGQSMQDVIFGGAPGRPAARAAEVELVLDDSDGTLGLGVPEISIVRRLDRSGEGEYRLAGARCRLVDVVELLSDTGLGREMHSVISQGRVESLVTSRPRERRMLIEEAAGLGKHRKRRRRAQLKLARTQDNLDRALDVEREARARLRPLKRQAEAADLHERLERQSLEIRSELAADDVRARRAALAAAEASAAEVRARRDALGVELTETARRREAAEEALATRSAHREELSRRAYAARSAAERISDRAESVQAALTSVHGRLARSQQVLATLEDEVAADREDPAAASRITALEESLAVLERDREAELARELTALEAELAGARERVAARTDAAQRAQSVRQEAECSAEAGRSAIREAERVADAARRDAARVGGELAAVNQFLRNHAGTPHGVTALADALAVDPGYELAVAAALDGRLAAAVVDGPEQAVGLLDRAGTDGGRALIVPATVSAPEAGESRWDRSVAAERLTDHVRGDGEALALARALLADVWVVEDVGGCPETFGGVAVTRAGRVWSARTRELRQAPAVGEDRILAERNRREVLIADSERAVQAEVAARASVETATTRAAEADAERDRLVASHRAAVHALDEATEEARRISATIERRRGAPDDGANAGRRSQLTAELAAERSMVARAESERAERAGRLARLRASAAHDIELAPTVEAVLGALRGAAEAVAARLQSFDGALAADREAGESAAAQLRTCARQEAELHQRMAGENDALTAAEIALQRSRDQSGDAEAELAELAARLELELAAAPAQLSAEERAQLSARLERVARRREQLGPVNPLAQQEYAEALAHVEELEGQRADLETALRELGTLIADTDRQIRTTFEQTFQATAAAFEDLAAQLFPGGRGRLRLVSEDARGQPARVLGAQPVDGDGSGAHPPDEGSSGAVEVDEEEDARADEDLLGVEIEITPAGKDPKRLSLLSGGEKSMTALAFLFAVFLARPCPFYILDEVEAALDDLNIGRFLALLDRYSARAQFIVVTHQKRTMDAADSLYGVSMGSDGISKVISRRLGPAVEAAA